MLNKRDRSHEAYKFANGFKNIAHLVGPVRRIEEGVFYIQQTRNENHMLPVYLPRGTRLPPFVREMTPVNAKCRMHGGYIDDTKERADWAFLLDIEYANTIDMPPSEAWLIPVPDGAPVAPYIPEQYGLSYSPNRNRVEVSGFIGGMQIKHNPYSTEHSTYLELLVQQSGDPDKALIVRVTDKHCKVIKQTLHLGAPIFIIGEYRMKVHPVDGKKNPVTGLDVVRIQPIITTQKPFVATPEVLRIVPDWAKELGRQSGGIIARAVNRQPVVQAPIIELSNENL